MSLIPGEVFKQVAEKRTAFLMKRFAELNIICESWMIPKVMHREQVDSEKTWYNYYMFYNDPKQIFMFSEKIEIIVDGTGISVKQDLDTTPIPVIHHNKN